MHNGQKDKENCDYNNDPKGDQEREGLWNIIFVCKMGRMCVQRETGVQWLRVGALGTWWLAMSFFQTLG